MTRRRRSLFRHLAFLSKFKLTPLGRIAALLIFLSAIGSITVEIPIYQIFCGVVTLFGIAEVIGIAFRPSLELKGRVPERVTIHESFPATITVKNTGLFPAYDLMAGFFSLPNGISHTNATDYLPSLGRGESTVLSVELVATSRGEYFLPALHIHSTFPLNLMRFGSAKLQLGRVTVLPKFFPLERIDLPVSRRYQQGGVFVDTRTGNPPEYVGNREYIPGEPVKRLDFRAWARVGKPIVREYQDEFCSRVALVLDTRFPTEPRSRRTTHSDAIEAAVSLTAAVSVALQETDSLVDLFSAGPDLFLFSASPGSPESESILEILASVEGTAHDSFEKVTPVIAESLESISVVTCILLDWDAVRESFVRLAVENGCEVRVIVIRDSDPTLPLPEDINFSQFPPREILEGMVTQL